MYSNRTRMMKRNLLLVLVSFFFVQAASAQKRKKPSKAQEDLLGTAEYFYDDGQYLRSLPIFQKLSESDSTNAYFHLKMGLCYIHKSDEKEKSITEFETAYRINPSLPDINCFRGMALHLNNKFDQAIEMFNKYITDDNPSPVKKKLASHYIEYCQNGKLLIQHPMDAEILNLGSPINSSASEYAPVISSDESTLIFTYKGERSKGGLMDEMFNPDPDGDYYEDIFISQRVGREWLTPESISDKINTKGHDASIALSSDGQTLFIFKSTPKDKGDIFVSTLKGDEWSEPVRLDANINSNSSWEGSCSITSDGQLLYFASDRKGGFGGRDIYVAKRQTDGSWGVATNLGPTVNSEYDEDAPFIHPDGIDLFFSSKGHNSMGGYDIMYSTKKGETWSEPINLGYPLNTTEDERYYVLTASGEFGYFSTDRKGTLGENDIYTVTPGFQGERPILALVVGTVMANDKPTDAKIRVTNVTTGEQQGLYSSNSASGKFLIALTPGNEYKVAIEVEGIEPHIEYVNVKNIETFVQVTDDVKMYTEAYKQANKPVIADAPATLQSKIDQQIAKYRQEQKYDVYEAKIYKQNIQVHGEEIHDSVQFVVELGKYECPKDFNGTLLSSLGLIQNRIDFSNNTIYFTGPYKTFLDAELNRQKAIKLDSSLHSTAVTVLDRGIRKTIQQYFATDYKRPDYVIPVETKLQKCKENTSPASSPAMAVKSGSRTEAEAQMKSMVKDHGNYEVEGLTYKLELAAVSNAADFDTSQFAKYGPISKKVYPDGKIHYSIGNFKNLREAVAFKDSLIAMQPAAAKSIVMVLDFGKPKTVKEYFEEHPAATVAAVEPKKVEPKPGDPVKTQPVVVKEKPVVIASPVVESNSPCISDTLISFAAFVGKDLNDKATYDRLISTAARLCPEGLTFTVQIGA
jgi:hypothetical protein